MSFRREKILPAEQTPVETQKTPEYSRETLDMIESIDSGLENSQSLLGGLGRVAREQIISDPEELEEIYAPKQIGRLGLKTEHGDAKVFEAADKGLQVRNTLKRVITLGLAGSKYGIKSREGLLDTRKLKKGAEEQKRVLYPDELLKAAKKFGLDPSDIDSRDFFKTYAEGKKGAEKIILRKKTEQAADQTAGDILERRLRELETKTGPDLIKQKENLEEFIKEKKQYADILDEASMAKVENEEIARQELIEQNQENLNSDLETLNRPLWEHRQELAGALSDFSSLLEEITGQGKAYEHEINGLQTKISKIKGSKQIREILGDNIKEWEEQKAQAEINLKDFREKKEALNKRISQLKTSQAEVDAALDRINNIGKTKQELKTEKAAKQREKLEQQKKNRAYRASEQTPELAFASTESEQAGGEEAARVAGAAAGTSPVVSVSESKKPEAKADATLEQPQTIEPAEEKIIKMLISEWLDLLGLKNAVGPAKTAVENNFKVDKIFNLNNSMTLSQARQNYTQYLVDFLKIPAVRAQRQANAKFEEIIKKLSV